MSSSEIAIYPAGSSPASLSPRAAVRLVAGASLDIEESVEAVLPLPQKNRKRANLLLC